MQQDEQQAVGKQQQQQQQQAARRQEASSQDRCHDHSNCRNYNLEDQMKELVSVHLAVGCEAHIPKFVAVLEPKSGPQKRGSQKGCDSVSRSP